MANGYLTFLDYFELRRRIEKRLTSGRHILLHIIIFAVGTGMIGSAAWSPIYDPQRGYFINPTIGHWISLWSGILLAHGVWSYWHSGARSGQRETIIESEMRQVVQTDDLYLSQHPKALFRLHRLLSENISKRYSLISILLIVVTLNALIWIPWTLLGQATTSFAWHTSLALVVPFILLVAINTWVRTWHEWRMRWQLEVLLSDTDDTEAEDYERDARLSEDEMVTLDDYMLKEKRKRA